MDDDRYSDKQDWTRREGTKRKTRTIIVGCGEIRQEWARNSKTWCGHRSKIIKHDKRRATRQRVPSFDLKRSS